MHHALVIMTLFVVAFCVISPSGRTEARNVAMPCKNDTDCNYSPNCKCGGLHLCNCTPPTAPSNNGSPHPLNNDQPLIITE
ncbi:unnamed protein product [Cuscuta campestris]|uniref:Uncharacterized protein n=1 Tax=Cuscuta campestris TaxID=132261 RepID=A0A484N2J4_9ASTE|nr:unnamed protein product [Cuscuta campestris]